MKYRRDYQETHDIDWFFRHNGKVYHAASNGGMLPDSVDSLKNRTIQEKLEELKGVYEVQLSNSFNVQGEDLSSFKDYAAKGFISLDRKEVEDDRLVYQRVAYPANGEMFENEDILALMPVLDDNEITVIE